MEFTEVVYTVHVVQKMDQRGIPKSDIERVIRSGEMIAVYLSDRPFPSQLLLGETKTGPLHVVASFDETTGKCYVITAYYPDPKLWDKEFRGRKQE